MAERLDSRRVPARPRWRRSVAGVVALATLAALAAFLIRNRDYIALNYGLRPGAFLGIGALVVGTLALRSLAHRLLFARLSVSASFFDWFRLVSVSAFTSYLPFSAGMFAKAFFLKRIHSVPYRTFALGQVALMILIVSTNGAVGLLTLGLRFPEHAIGIVGAGFAMMIGAGALMFLPRSVTQRIGGRWFPWEADTAAELRGSWPAVSLLQAGILLATAGTLKISFDLGTSEVGFAACVVFAAASVLTRLVSITPGAIGIREFLVGGLAYLTGFELRDAVIASTLARTVEVVVIFALGGVFSYGLSGRMISRAPIEEPDRARGPNSARDQGAKSQP